MKRLSLPGRLLVALRLCSFVFATAFPFSFLDAQIAPFNPALFGVDGDLLAEQRESGSFDPAGTHDWFRSAGTGFAVFDTTGAAAIRQLLAAGKNHAFTKKMQAPPYSLQDGLLMLGGTYARDYIGLADLGETSDKTVFVPSAPNNKSYMGPASWTTVPTGAIPSKTDIIDTYIHMRRNGSSLATGAPSPLMVYFAASTLSTGGDHHLDFELFKSNLDYNPVTGLFSSGGPAATGGRNIWEFAADGSVKTFGEMALSFSFNSTEVSDIAIYIWVPFSTYDTARPRGFDFVPGDWNGTSKNGGFGYARIAPKAGGALRAWGTVNASPTAGPAWGTNTRETGLISAAYFTNTYGKGQFAEAGIDLTSLGIDPALAGTDRCRSPYLKVMVKSRSSSAFSSALQDFVAPYNLFEEPILSADIAPPGILTCSSTSLILSPRETVAGAFYSWSTADGRIVGSGRSVQAPIDQPGTYTLAVAPYEGCDATTSTVTVLADTIAPVATALYTGVLSTGADNYITLRGDTAQSNEPNPFGPSQGLLWQWSGPGGYSAAEQNPRAYTEGEYRLQVTEKRNGCSSVATVAVSKAEQMVLPLALLQFSGKAEGGQVKLHWQVGENEGAGHFEVERSLDGGPFVPAAVVLPSEVKGSETYTFRELLAGPPVSYRLKVWDQQGRVQFSRVVYIRATTPESAMQLSVLNPVSSNLEFTYRAAGEKEVAVTLYHASGAVVYAAKHPGGKGVRRYTIAAPVMATKGLYILEVAEETSAPIRVKVVKP